MKTVKCAIIGAGWWATAAHIPAIKNHPHAELLGIQKRKRDVAEKIAVKFGIPHACTTTEEILGIKNLDAVIISSTPNMHYSQTKAALENGFHVLVEKPMTITLSESVELMEIAVSKNVHFLISCPWHYTVHAIEARKRILAGKLGKIKMISVLMTNFSKGLYKDKSISETIKNRNNLEFDQQKPFLEPNRGSYSNPEIAGGGQIYCQVSHAAAYLSFLTELKPLEVFARFDNAGLDVDVFDTLNIRMDNGALVSLASTGATMPSKRNYEVRVYGEEGMVFLELWKGTAVFYYNDDTVERLPDLASDDIYPARAPAENLINVIRGVALNGSPARHGLNAMKIIDAACRSVAQNENIII